MASMISSGWPARDGVAGGDGDADHGALQRRPQGHGPLRPLRSEGLARADRAAALAVRQHRQRIDGVDLGAGRPRAGAGARAGAEIEPGRQLAGAPTSSAMCSSTKRVWTSPAAEAGMGQQGAAGRRCWWPRPRCGIPRARGRPWPPREAARARMHDQLGQQGVEARAGAVAGIAEAVDAHAGPGRRLEGRQQPAARLGRAVGGHGLQVDPRLHGMPRGAGTSAWSRFRSASVAPAAISSCRRTRSRPVTSSVTVCSTCRRGLASMKTNAAPLVAVDQELDGAEAAVAGGLGQRGRRRRRTARAAPAARWAGAISTSFWRWRCRLHSRSQRWLTWVPSPTICTSMWRARGDELLDIEVAVAEGRLGLGRAALEGLVQLAASRDRAACRARRRRPPP